ncbi:cation diffusion facilitator family transporter [Pseudenhygromyxa sp. WMMC2535]|uniref:cation diffusion facilitator family transporter n=1 Tax=Pseudenhygromyxa sp. WMMC2535 TaxID=2712867 RepID=UPI001557539A|nr:cation diffusion facilitator family transporter [Pseudenhygromyxa sp. WMMC2535]NVB41719.1 cation diffusion facilitator family transporter [Pseudenhygromyxa sp. WMMC2535]
MASSKGAVFGALIGNSILTVVKFTAFFLSGSGAMFSEAVHSAADAFNQGLLFIGIRSSERPADHAFHYGYGYDRYLFSLLSAVGIFVFGCGVTIYHGIHALLHPAMVEPGWLSYAVLALSFFTDGFVLLGALRVIWKKKGEHSLFQYLRTTSDPTAAAVLLEDSVATAGVLVAGLAIWLTEFTQNPVYDAIGALIVGAMLGLVAVWLGFKNRQLLLGPAIPEEVWKGVLEYLEAHPAVDRVRKPKSRVVGAGEFRFAAEIDFNGRYLGAKQLDLVSSSAAKLEDAGAQREFAEEFGERVVQAVADEVDAMEAELRRRYPELIHVELEAD